MILRGDKEHDVACWFGVNQARIAEVKDGSHGSIAAALPQDLPPKGPPGVKGRKLRASVAKALAIMDEKGGEGVSEASAILKDASEKYDRNET
jgi:hypothetical protein